MLKSSDFHNGDQLSKDSALSANIEFELEAIYLYRSFSN